MAENKEIEALIKLIDDPDEYVFENVSNKIISMGSLIIPQLQDCGTFTENVETYERVQSLISKLQFNDLRKEFKKWNQDSQDLLAGAMLVSKYLHPDLDSSFIFKEVEKLRRNIWLELNNYLTPLEQVNVIGSIFYNYAKHTGIQLSYDNADHFLLSKALENKQGNPFANGTIILILCSLLDVPVHAVNIPNLFLLAYFHDNNYAIMNVKGHPSEKIKFYIDPLNGQMYSHKDIENYFKKLGMPMDAAFFEPFGSKNIIILLLSELVKCFDSDINNFRKLELRELIKIVALK